MQLYPGTFASCLCPCPCVDGSGGDGDGGGFYPGPGFAPVLLRTGPCQAVPGRTPSAQPPGGAAASARMPSVL